MLYDPKKVEYKDLLRFFFRIHDSTTLNSQGNDIGTQYRSAIFYYDEDQKNAAEAIKDEVQKSGKVKGTIVTEITQATTFYPAEDYHQGYLDANPDGMYIFICIMLHQISMRRSRTDIYFCLF
jgi:peptide-methionine (S)-S-oxide reductase